MKPLPHHTPLRRVLPVLFLGISSAPLWAIILYSILFHQQGLNYPLIIVLFTIAVILGLVLFVVYFYIIRTLHLESAQLNKDLTALAQENYAQVSLNDAEPDLDGVSKSLTAAEETIQQKSLETKRKLNEMMGEKEVIKRDRDTMGVVLSSINHGVLALDKDKKVQYFNKIVEQLTGAKLNNSLGKHIDEIVHLIDGKDQINAELYIGQSESIARKFKENGLEMLTKDGSKIVVSLTCSAVTYQNGQTGWIINFHDISEQVESDALKIDFVSMAAHELRTPLTSVRGYASLLKMEKWDSLDDGGKTLVDRLMISSEILANFIENLLNVTRIEQNRFVMQMKPVDLTQLFKDTVNNLVQQANTRNQKLILQINGVLPVVYADSFRINQVLTNLVANAIHYTQDGGTITVTAQEKDNYLQVDVTDTGQGIPAEALPKLFTKFFRVSGVLEQGTKGTGLGLFISKSIIEMHKGKIWVASVPAHGSTFTFIIPKADESMMQEDQK